MTQTDVKRLEDKLDHAILLARQSTPESLSPILKEIRNKIEAQGQKLDEHIAVHETDVRAINAKLDPVAGAYSNVSGFRSTVLTVTTLLVAGWGGYEALKRIIGK
jgi:hypothetical protein